MCSSSTSIPTFPGLQAAARIIDDYLPQLASHDYNHILRKLRIKESELKEAISIITSLNPRPGSEITPPETTYVIPDVFVSKHNGRWRVELNPETRAAHPREPRLRLVGQPRQGKREQFPARQPAGSALVHQKPAKPQRNAAESGPARSSSTRRISSTTATKR